MDKTEYVYSEQTCKYECNLSSEQLITLANTIWQDVKTELKKVKSDTEDNEVEIDKLYVTMFDKYKDFGTSFPVILRWMVQMKRYSERAFKKFIVKYSTYDIKSKKDFLILQADYVVYLYEETNHYTKNEVNKYRNFIIKQLLDEDSVFEQIHKDVEQEELKNKEKKSNECREKLYSFLLKK